MSQSKLFQPIQVGDLKLSHRVVMAPLARKRVGDTTHLFLDIDTTTEYYTQRASPGALIIAESALIAPKAGGQIRTPGIYNEDHIAMWKKITSAVHARGGFIVCQLWAAGRTAQPDVLKAEDPSFPFVSASDIPLEPTDGAEGPSFSVVSASDIALRPLTIPEIHEYTELYAHAARTAIEAGFDGVELHGANGYLPDQFLQDVTNQRTDEYGGSIENRCRFALEVLDAIVKAVGEKKTGVRISPWETWQGMRMKDPKPTFAHFFRSIRDKFPDFAYVHVIEARVNAERDRIAQPGEGNDFLREIWAPRPFISAGGYKRDLAIETADQKGDLIAFGRFFIANPDLPLRLKKNIPLTKYDRATFYTQGKEGYIDYPFSGDV